MLCISQGAIIIHEVYEDGAAAKDSRIWAGDQVLEVSISTISAGIITCRHYVITIINLYLLYTMILGFRPIV